MTGGVERRGAFISPPRHSGAPSRRTRNLLDLRTPTPRNPRPPPLPVGGRLRATALAGSVRIRAQAPPTGRSAKTWRTSAGTLGTPNCRTKVRAPTKHRTPRSRSLARFRVPPAACPGTPSNSVIPGRRIGEPGIFWTWEPRPPEFPDLCLCLWEPGYAGRKGWSGSCGIRPPTVGTSVSPVGCPAFSCRRSVVPSERGAAIACG
jgi:hypothetical protein